MDIYKVIINGFKSFGDKTDFVFDKNITGIVGPNGSGKSNITEAIRFVLGEQSFKSIRGKDMTDFLFRGSDKKASRASVEIIFKKNPISSIQESAKTSENLIVKNALEKEELSISRVVYGDGKNDYQLNGQVVRLKDIQEILLLIGVGNRQSWHISQGESDKILLASKEERKSIIEDALNLRIYHNRINDAERKLEKTNENIRQINLQRRELAPEINTLQKQVEKIEKGDKYRQELEEKVVGFIFYKNQIQNNLEIENNNLEAVSLLENFLLENRKKQEELSILLHKQSSNDANFLEDEKNKEQKVLNFLENEKRNLDSKILNLQNKISYINVDTEKSEEELENILEQIQSLQSVQNDYIFVESDIKNTEKYIDTKTDAILIEENLENIKINSENIRKNYKTLLLRGSLVSKDNIKEISYLSNIKNRLTEKILKNKDDLEKNKIELKEVENNFQDINLKINLSKEKFDSLYKQILEYKYEMGETEKEMQLLSFKQKEIESKIINKKQLEQKLFSFKNEFEVEKSEFKNILGPEKNPLLFASQTVLSNGEDQEQQVPLSNNWTEAEFVENKKSIERLKIRLEEINISDRENVLLQHKNLLDKDAYLENELRDLSNSISNLENLILELKTHLNSEFTSGLENINNNFNKYIQKLFGGGTGKVVEVKIEKKPSPNLSVGEEQNISDNQEEKEEKTGIEVEIELPKKKVKGLHSLSGGERALTSIALNFSILNQNRLPFMILDEADATLDEANAKRYGELLFVMSQETKLIVVTHNRETMHFADQMYGVTLSKNGASKVLSVSFADALQYAK
jgi:chromosome segregation protein